jgi:ABC-type cobalamin/Fe3+-siderophores transport system ATPase subunit
MRSFVNTFKFHLETGGVQSDDEFIWKLLSRFQILIFDYNAPGSANEIYARECSSRALRPEDRQHSKNLWSFLTQLALKIAATGGDRNRERLIDNILHDGNFRLSGYSNFASVRNLINESTKSTLADICDSIGDIKLLRTEKINAVHAALKTGRYLEIRGDAGVGKSAVLKHFAMQLSNESTVIVLSPYRIVKNGWEAMRAQIGFEGSAHDLLVDLASTGGIILFVDNLDLFELEARLTVIDLIRASAEIENFSVIVTVRSNFAIDEPGWLPNEVLNKLGRAETIQINSLSDAEVEEICQIDAKLTPLLAKNHPAFGLARNLYRLSRLVNQKGRDSIRTEVDMALQWWKSADGSERNRRERQRLLKSLALKSIAGNNSMDVSEKPVIAIEELIKSESLRGIDIDHVAFFHDVLRDWAIANLLNIDSKSIEQLPFNRPVPAFLSRSIEIFSCMVLQESNTGQNWLNLLKKFSTNYYHGSWRRLVLISIVHSEIAEEFLNRLSEDLLAENGKLLIELIRT